MKGIERHLYSRKGYYYFRKSFPRNLHFLLPCKEIWIGLNTQDLGKARILSVQIDYEFSNLLDKLKGDLRELLPEQSTDKAIHDCVTAINKIKDSYGYEMPARYDHIKRQKGENLFEEILSQ